MLIPSWIISILAFLNVGILYVWYRRKNSWTAIALMIPLVYIGVICVTLDNLDDVDALNLLTYGVIILLVCKGIVYAKHAGLLGMGHNGTLDD